MIVPSPSIRDQASPLMFSVNHAHPFNAAGVFGVFGGEEATSAVAIVHTYQQQKWLGWYNSPGSYEIAKCYGRLARSKFFDVLFPGVHVDPATLVGLDGSRGPRFHAAHTGTVINGTGHLASLFTKGCSSFNGVPIDGRKTQPTSVTIVELGHVPKARMSPPSLHRFSPLWAMVPILTSFATCAACAIVSDWWSLSLILLGMLANGVSCLIIGSGKLVFMHPTPAPGSPSGDGILISDGHIMLLKGPEGAVNCITQGRFSLHFNSEPRYRNIGWCSVLLMFQFTAQLVLIPEGSLFGQLMFIASFVVSWMYNLWLSSLDKERIQLDMLMSMLQKPQSSKFTLGTWTSMVVFVLLVLAPEDPRKLMDVLLPNDTKLLRLWKDAVASNLQEGKPPNFDAFDHGDETITMEDMTELELLFGDAASAYQGFAMSMNQGLV